MAVAYKYSVSSFLRHSRCDVNFLGKKNANPHLRRIGRANFSIGSLYNPKRLWHGSMSLLATGVGVGALFGGGYTWYKSQKIGSSGLEGLQMNEVVELEHEVLPGKPDVPISRYILNENDKTNLKLTLFQYPTCPFCCKVRAFLDYFGIPYEVVEVDPVLRQQTSWTKYKKVPILLVKTDDGYQQLNDSTMIISALTSFLNDKKLPLRDVIKFYPMIEYKDGDGNLKSDILNRYFLMFQEAPRGKAYESVKDERNWRMWADDVLVHTLSPNVYRTPEEALQAFTWFSEVGEWDRLFPAWERNLIVYVGAGAMWMIGKMLRRRHRLKEDVRESLYDECRKWMRAVKGKGTPFFGGRSPNLADLAVYGVLSSIEGCSAFNDLLRNTSIGSWYYPVKEAVSNHAGNPDAIFAHLNN